jgi:hypothetical protein
MEEYQVEWPSSEKRKRVKYIGADLLKNRSAFLGSQCVRDCNGNPTAKYERGVAMKSPPEGNAQKSRNELFMNLNLG